MKYSIAQDPRVLVVPPEAIGLKGREGRKYDGYGLLPSTTSAISTLQTVFDKVFHSKSNIMSTDDMKTEIILGSLRNVLLVCELCPKPPTDPPTTPKITTSTRPPGRGECLLGPVDCKWGPWVDTECP